ncbi:MAG: TOMM precursor leader peptide-binding protein [Actinobacteria bacterium]|nr:TOMM precursor leader peptide-binding protein [Actinomycetota bacterium]
MRIQLLPGLQRAWRGPTTLQLGVSPRRSVLLEGLTPADVRLVERLDGGLDPTELTAPDDLVALLRDAGALVPARAGRSARSVVGRHEELEPDAATWALVHRGCGDGWDLLAARAARTVLVVGEGRVADAVATALTAAGIGTTDRRPRLTERGVPRPACVVLVEPVVADSARAGDLGRRDVPHLSVVVREGDVVVGPLVRPGTDPCLRCLDLHRTALDPDWPGVLAQLLSGPRDAPEETTVAALAGRLAALAVLTLLDGRTTPAACGATLEVELPDGLVTRRPWPAHPQCGCRWPPADEGGDAPGTTTSPAHRARPQPATVTMEP